MFTKQGPELDRQIEEVVFGIHVCVCPEADKDISAVHGDWCYNCSGVLGATCWSSKMEFAWLLVERLVKYHWEPKLTYNPSARQWTVGFSQSDGVGDFCPCGEAKDDSPAAAICLATLDILSRYTIQGSERVKRG